VTRRDLLVLGLGLGVRGQHVNIARNWTSDYEQGNGEGVTQVSTDTYRVDLEANDPKRTWTIDCDVTLTGVAGRTLSFQLRYKHGTAKPYHEVEPLTWKPIWTDDDGANWNRVSSVSWDIARKIISFTLPRAIASGGVVRLTTMGVPYTWNQYQSDMDRWLASGLITRTRVTTSKQGRPIYRLTLLEGTPSGKSVLAMYRNGHETERPATWCVRSMIDWATGPSAEAERFRSRNVLHSILIANPDGFMNGWLRCNADGFEFNRWATSNGKDTGTPIGPTLKQEGAEQFAIHKDIETLDLDLYFDFHNANHAPYTPFYSPTSSALRGLPLSTYDTTGLIRQPDNDLWVGNRTSHRNVAHRLGALTATVDGGWVANANGSNGTPATMNTVGIALLRAVDDFLH
jgi:hypothetical protein